MGPKRFIAFCIFICGMCIVCGHLDSQALVTPPPSPLSTSELTFSTQLGSNLLRAKSDFREYLFSYQTIHSLIDSNKICLVSFAIDHSKKPEDHSANEWTNVGMMLDSLGYLNGKQSHRQIRIVQRDTIVQSGPPSEPRYENEKWFLDWPLYPGDVVILVRGGDY
jgi:hypothetical protein